MKYIRFKNHWERKGMSLTIGHALTVKSQRHVRGLFHIQCRCTWIVFELHEFTRSVQYTGGWNWENHVGQPHIGLWPWSHRSRYGSWCLKHPVLYFQLLCLFASFYREIRFSWRLVFVNKLWFLQRFQHAVQMHYPQGYRTFLTHITHRIPVFYAHPKWSPSTALLA